MAAKATAAATAIDASVYGATESTCVLEELRKGAVITDAGNTQDMPHNVQWGLGTRLVGAQHWGEFHSLRDPAVTTGEHCTIDNAHFSLGRDAIVVIGDYTYLSTVLLMVEEEVHIGSYVLLGWNVAIADSDFHPMDPVDRIFDTMAISPLAQRRMAQRAAATRPVIIEDDVSVGANTLILKGVRIGAGACVDPGSLVTHDVPAGARVRGNPAVMVPGP